MAACCLHNLLRIRKPNNQEVDTEDPLTREVIPAPWRREIRLPRLQRPSNSRTTLNAKEQRQFLADYFLSPAGALSWQLDKI